MSLSSSLVSMMVLGSIYALMATAITVGYRPTNVFNFAQGVFFSLGGLLAASGEAFGLPWAVSVLYAVTVTSVLSYISWITAIRPVVRSGGSSTMWIISTLAFSIVLENAIGKVWNDEPRSFAPPGPLGLTRHRLLGLEVSSYQIAVVLATLVIVVLAELAYRSRRGRGILAIAEDREAAMLKGIPVERLSAISVVAGGGLAALCGALAAPLLFASIGGGFAILIGGFAAAVIGGLGSIVGALVGGYILAFSDSIAIQTLNPALQTTVALVIVLVVLTIRPSGLFGAARERRL